MDVKLRETAQQYEQLQVEIATTLRAKTLLDSQLQENRAVEEEFALLKDDDAVYKLIGPVLVKQERPEAVQNVKKRIEYICGEIKRKENQVKDLENKSDAKRNDIMKMQHILQEAAAKQQAKAN